jgi:hypothetical protein
MEQLDLLEHCVDGGGFEFISGTNAGSNADLHRHAIPADCDINAD